ncbi:MAG: hypothetical protein JSV03_03585 [Planctomycetota bacterium]|nr:MAG: hypothetical protein JSV03_03585 [Planctomycetota bacterium]
MSISLNRREFVAITAAGTIMLSGQPGGRQTLAADNENWPQLPRVKIHKVYAGRTGHAWPKPKFKPHDEVAKFERHLAKVEQKLGDVKFVGGELVQNPQQAAQVAAKLKDADGVLLFHLSISTVKEMQKIVDAGKPTVIFSQPFSGHGWMDVNQWRKAGKKIALLATSDYDEIVQAVALLRVPVRMRQSRMISVPGELTGTKPACSFENVKASLGTEVIPVSYQRVIDTYQTIEPKEAETEAEQYWIKPAQKIVEPTRDEIIKSARLYLAVKKIMQQEQAQAVTIKCLGGLPIDKLGYPCLTFSKLDDLGMVGVCERDIDSALTRLMFNYAFGIPGFITDPLFDTAKNAVIHAHCTAPTKMNGPNSKRAPFIIRTHRDDDKGASLEVELRVGQIITCAKLVNLDTILVSTGKITEIPDFEDRGCRTQITTEVKDAQKMLDNWGAGLLDEYGWVAQLHRVVFYGDLVQSTKHMADLMGLKVIEAM